MNNEIVIQIQNTIDKYNKKLNDEIKYASPFIKVDFLNDNIKNINKSIIIHLHKNVKRRTSLVKLLFLVKDVNIATLIEAGIFEFTLLYSLNNGIVETLIPAIYQDKVNEICKNIDPKSSILNKKLILKIRNSIMNAQMLAFLKPQDLDPDKWAMVIKKQQIRESKRKNVATTDLFECPKCKTRKCLMRELQTRSLDEASIKYLSCINCYHEFKR